MKKKLFLLLFTALNAMLYADVPPPPGGSGGSGPNGSDLPVGAPLNDGLTILFFLGLTYASINFAARYWKSNKI